MSQTDPQTMARLPSQDPSRLPSQDPSRLPSQDPSRLPPPWSGDPDSADAWDLDPGFLTVNHGSFGATPRCVLAAQRAWQARMEAQPSRFMSTIYPAAIREAAGVLAAFLGADPDRLAFVDNATTGCNAVLRSLALRPGDEVLVLGHAYGAVLNAVRHVAQQAGARVTVAQVPFPDPTETALLASVEAALTPRTRLAVIDHITSASALVLPAARIAAACRAAGVPVLIDGAHGPGQIDLDLAALGADWYVGNCHKWLCAPKGCAFLYARGTETPLHPVTISHGYGQGFLAEFDWTGTTDPSRFLAVTEAIAHHRRLGGARLRARNIALAATGAGIVASSLGTDTGASGPFAGAMATVRLPVADATHARALAIRSALMAAGTDAPVHALDGALWLRLSAFAYNREADYQRLAQLARQVLGT